MPVEDRVAGDQDPVAKQHDVPVRVAAQHEHAPAVDLVAVLEELRVAHPMHRVDEAGRLAQHRVDLLARHPVGDPVVDEPPRIVLAPRANALLVVLTALQHRRAGQLGDVARATDVVGMHVRDDDLLDRRIQLVEHGSPALLGRARAEAGIDQDPAAVRRAEEVAVDVVEAEREREGRAADPFLDLDHA